MTNVLIFSTHFFKVTAPIFTALAAFTYRVIGLGSLELESETINQQINHEAAIMAQKVKLTTVNEVQLQLIIIDQNGAVIKLKATVISTGFLKKFLKILMIFSTLHEKT